MCRYEDFSIITRESLAYTLRCLGLKSDADIFLPIMDKYVHLDLYPDAVATLAGNVVGLYLVSVSWADVPACSQARED